MARPTFCFKSVKFLRYFPVKRCFSGVSTGTNSKETHFGFETVNENEKEQKVYGVFHNVAGKYDAMNDAMSAGIHRLWKDHFIQKLGPTPGTQLIDVAGGTGDIAFRFLKYVDLETQSNENKNNHHNYVQSMDINSEAYSGSSSDSDQSDSSCDSDPNSDQRAHVTVCDINQAMLDVGKHRALRELNIKKEDISWLRGNAENLPLGDELFDAYTIAFGIRNCTHIDKVLEEAYRVLRPGGRFMCLEFSHVNNPLLKSIYDEYSFQVIPVMGHIIAGDWKSYQYLVESIRQFPNQKSFSEMIQKAGFKAVTFENLSFGVAAIHSGFKL